MLYEIVNDNQEKIQFDTVEEIIKSDKINDYTRQSIIYSLLIDNKMSYLQFDAYITSIILKTEHYALLTRPNNN